jgi:hypothetical protein
MLARHGVIVSRDDREFIREVEALYDDVVDTETLRDAVFLSSLGKAERLHVEQHRQREARRDDLKGA